MKAASNRYLALMAMIGGTCDCNRAVEVVVNRYRRPGDTLQSIARTLDVVSILAEDLPFDGGVFDDDGTLTVKINSSSPLVRQRFTLAHEIGHLMLADVLKKKVKSCAKDEQLERACDAIAAELLMPADEIASAVARWPRATPGNLISLAREFDVSLNAAALRVHYDLRLWQHRVGLWQFDEVGKCPKEQWFVGRRAWNTRTPPFAAFVRAMASTEPIRGRESYFEDSHMKTISVEVLNIGHGRLLGLVA